MKRVFFISFLFVILQSSSAFCSLSVDDYKQMEVEGKEPTYNEITQDQTSYENWVAYVDGKTDSHYNLPSFSDVAVLTENLLAYSVGNYADVASGVLDNLADTFSLGSDIWDFMTFNVQQMTFDYLPDFINLLKGGVDEEIYSSGSQSGEIVGGTYWVALPANIYYGYIYNQTASFTSNVGNTYFCLVRQSSNRVIPYFSSSNSGGIVHGGGWMPSSGVYMNSTYYANGNSYYYGGWANDYRTEWRLGSSSGQPLGIYSDYNTALAALWGNGGPSSEPALNGSGIIVNENPNINPVSLTSALGFPYKQTIINNYNNGTPIPWRPNNYNYVDYNYNYDVPFWGGQELETLDYPEEIEFPSIEFETIAIDENLDSAIESLDGSWIVKFFLVAILLLILGLIL